MFFFCVPVVGGISSSLKYSIDNSDVVTSRGTGDITWYW